VKRLGCRNKLTAIYLFTTNWMGYLVISLPNNRDYLSFPIENVKQLKNMLGDLLDLNDTHAACSDCLKDS
jgi:hypothetical protein